MKRHSTPPEEHAHATTGTFSEASITRPGGEEVGKKLGFSRAYSLALAPQLIYARSPLLSLLVSSRTHGQLEFQAVGSFFTVNTPPSDSASAPRLSRVPSGREDVFSDNTLDLRAKRGLMKFLRFVAAYDEEAEQERWDGLRDKLVRESLSSDFALPEPAIAPLLALALSPTSGSTAASSARNDTATMGTVVPRIARHLRSLGMFGPGFAAVLPKWGGLAEITQVACRAGAVGGGIYVLGRGIKSATPGGDDSTALELSEGEKITTRWVVGCPEDLPLAHRSSPARDDAAIESTKRSISVVSSPLTTLFPPTSEGGVVPAGAVVIVDVGSEDGTPVHILVHSNESGECPSGQCKCPIPFDPPHPTTSTHLDVRPAGDLMNNTFEYLSTLSEHH